MDELIEYYVKLLIIQYAGRPKAQATIRAFAKALMADGVMFAVRDAYNIETAVGVQLDVIGKYVGIDRFYNITAPEGYFRTPDYEEVNPQDEPGGFTDYAGFDVDDQYNGTMTYNSIVTKNNQLNDEDYRQLIKLKIIQNHSNHSHQSIDDSIFAFFGTDVIPTSQGNMHMYYFISDDASSIVLAAQAKGVLPRPMGVGVGFIDKPNNGGLFGYTTYSAIQNNNYPPVTTGYTTYADYATKEGKTLTYRDIH